MLVSAMARKMHAFIALSIAISSTALPGAMAQSSAAIASALRGMDSPDVEIRVDSYLALTRVASTEGGVGALYLPDQIEYLLHRYPDQAGQIRTSLIAALEREEMHLEGLRQRKQTFDESYSEHYATLIWAVSSLRDPRAVMALLGAMQI